MKVELLLYYPYTNISNFSYLQFGSHFSTSLCVSLSPNDWKLCCYYEKRCEHACLLEQIQQFK